MKSSPITSPAHDTNLNRPLPPHLVAQIDDYLARLGPFDRVFVHSDLGHRHVFVETGRLTGIIDWATRW
jgi:aminoglycoside phosphotransferase (APT) family kinase protein